MEKFKEYINEDFQNKLTKFNKDFNSFVEKGYNYYKYNELEELSSRLKEWCLNRYSNDTLNKNGDLFDSLRLQEKSFFVSTEIQHYTFNKAANDFLSFDFLNLLVLDLLREDTLLEDNIIRAEILLYEIYGKIGLINGSERYLELAKIKLGPENLDKVNNVLSEYKNENNQLLNNKGLKKVL